MKSIIRALIAGAAALLSAGLADKLRSLGGLPPSLIAGDVLHDLADFSGQSRFEDDVSLIVARFDPAVAPLAREGAPPAAPPVSVAPGLR